VLDIGATNVEVVRRVMDAEHRRDTATIFALYDVDIEWDASRVGGPEVGHPGTLRGHDGVRSWLRSWYEGFGNVSYETEELIDAGEHVVLVVRQRGRGRASGADVSLRLYGAWTVRDRKVVRVVWFLDRIEALKAVGLET
jgi:ketosteroid isomerase-like protein